MKALISALQLILLSDISVLHHALSKALISFFQLILLHDISVLHYTLTKALISPFHLVLLSGFSAFQRALAKALKSYLHLICFLPNAGVPLLYTCAHFYYFHCVLTILPLRPSLKPPFLLKLVHFSRYTLS